MIHWFEMQYDVQDKCQAIKTEVHTIAKNSSKKEKKRENRGKKEMSQPFPTKVGCQRKANDEALSVCLETGAVHTWNSWCLTVWKHTHFGGLVSTVPLALQLSYASSNNILCLQFLEQYLDYS